MLEQAAIRSKEAMRSGKEPACLLDFWTQQILAECDEAEAAGTPPPKYSHISEMAYVVMDFLFASQVGSGVGCSCVLNTLSIVCTWVCGWCDSASVCWCLFRRVGRCL